METNSTQQEILLVTGSRFSSRHCFEKNDKTNHLTVKAQLEEACWNGLIKEMLPEICEHFSGNKNLYLWQVWETNSFIEIELGEIPAEKDGYLSIDPYSFLPAYFLS